MARHRVGSLKGLSPGSVMEAVIDGKPIAVCNAGGELHALDGVCPHKGGPLGQGALHDKTLVCPWHAWEYCVSGQNDFDPNVRLNKFPVSQEGDEIYIDVS